MMWQMWTAFGIMLGYVADLAFFKVPNKPHITGLNWRLMLASVLVSITALSFSLTNSAQGWYACTLPHGPSLFLPRISALAHVKGSVRGCLQVARAATASPCASCPRSLLLVLLHLFVAQPLDSSSDIHVLLETEKELTRGRNRYVELFTVPRNRRATLASFVVMFM
jgi:hypothetical protein